MSENAFEGTDEVRSTIGYGGLGLPANVENLTLLGTGGYGSGNELANVLTGNEGDNGLWGGGGGDTLIGGGGIDGASYYSSPAGVTVSLLTNTGRGGDAEGDTLSGIENLDGSAFADTLVGDSGANQLVGEGGDDTLIGAAGSDVLFAGLGNDHIDAGEGDDLIHALGGGPGTVQTIIGGPGRDTFQPVGWFGQGGEARIADFAVGVGGDILDFDRMFPPWRSYSSFHGNPFDASVGVLRLVQQGPDTLAQWDEDGAGGAGYDWQTQAVLENVTATSLTGENIKGGIPPQGGPLPMHVTAGTEGPDYLQGWIGPDQISLLGGDDRIFASYGDDTIDGGAGFDGALFGGAVASYHFIENGAQVTVSGPDGTDTLTSIEELFFEGLSFSIADRSHFDPLFYLNQNPDVAAAAIDPLTHYQNWGWVEGRDPNPSVNLAAVDGLEYIASYGDLAAAFGVNKAEGYQHFATQGLFEGRTISFDGLEYIASYNDLINAFGANTDTGASHYIQAGRFEGSHQFRRARIHRLLRDLIKAFGANGDAGASHFIVAGHNEQRHTSFDGLQYIASYKDLIEAFHTQVAATADPDIGANHYILAGHAEHRAPDQFDAAQYLANYTDLQAAFGTNTEAATLHYITAGYFEGRVDHPL